MEFKIKPETKAYLKEELQTIYEKKVNSNFKKVILNQNTNYISFGLLILSSVLIVISFIKIIKADNRFWKLILILAIIILLISLSIWALANTLKKQIQTLLNQNIKDFYAIIAKNNVAALEINNINSEFNIYPENFLPSSWYNSSIWTEKVISGIYKNQNFNMGTIIEKIVENSGQKNYHVTYNRYQYLVTEIPKQNYVTTIKPETFISKVFLRHKNKLELEAKEFEKIFLLDYSEPIKLRKLLPPKVMAAMTDYSKKTQKLPLIFLNNDKVTLMKPFYNITSLNAKTGAFVKYQIDNNVETTLDNIINTIENDIYMFLELSHWVIIMDLL